MRRTSEFLDLVRERLAPLGPVSARAMFGGWGIYVDGQFCAIVHGEALYLKVDAASRPQFEAQRSQPFRPFAGKPMTMLYYEAPADFFEDPKQALAWGGLALQAARRQKRQPARARKR